MSDSPAISVIIPTRGLPERAAMVRRAIDSVLAQDGVHAVPIVVLNGSECDETLASRLHADRRLRTAALPEADLPAALHAGRDLVDTPYFAELDDDDVLLPGALALRVRALAERPECDVAVTNGIVRGTDGDTLHIDDVSAIHRDPLRALLARNWLLPGSWLCHTDRVGGWLFTGMPAFRECTYLALRFATACRMVYVETPTLVHYMGTPRAEFNSRAYILASLAATRRLLELDLPSDVRDAFRAQLAAACLGIASQHRRDRRLALACVWSLRSCLYPGGPALLGRQLQGWVRKSVG